MKSFARKLISFILVLSFLTIPFVSVSAKEYSGYDDVQENKWYTTAIKYVVNNDLMVGVSDTLFGTNTTLTRSMAVLILAKVGQVDLSKYTHADFSDVPDGKWFTKAIAWASETEISVGSAGKFMPNDPVTREQLAVMMYKFANKFSTNNIFETGPESIDGFSDASKAHKWAVDSLIWAVHNGLISGTNDNRLNPLGYATRAEAAVMFYNLSFIQNKNTLPPNTKEADSLKVKESDTTRIVCWGDSLTAGYGSHNSYPDALQYLVGQDIPVLNYGVSSETYQMIAARQGAYDVYVAPCTIPATTDEISINLVAFDSTDGSLIDTDLGYYGDLAINNVNIDGVEGFLTYKQKGNTYTFKRSTPGEEHEITRITKIVTYGMIDRQSNDISIIYIGQNNSFPDQEAINELLNTQKRMVEYSGSDKYLVVSYLAYQDYFYDINTMNNAFANEFGDNYLDVRTYFLDVNGALKDAGITPTEEDLEDIEQGIVPRSLRYDFLHGDDTYYYLFAKKIYEKLIDLGYIDAYVQKNPIDISLPKDPIYLCTYSAKNYLSGATSMFYAARSGCGPYHSFDFTYHLAEGYTATLTLNNETYELDPNKTTCRIDNLYPDTTYSYTVKIPGCDDCTGEFTTADIPRFMYFNGVTNTRDIGGLKTNDGKTVKYDMIIRGTELDGLVEKSFFLKDTNETDKIGFAYDFDLRENVCDEDEYISPLGASVPHKFYYCPMYEHVADPASYSIMRDIFTDLAKPENYPMYLHCTYGKDRTGVILYMLEAILGVSYDDIIIDYELSTYVSPTSYYNSILPNEELMEKTFEPFAGDTINEKVEDFLVNYLGITNEQIESIRSILLK